jgi:hypothetical protein
MPCAPSPAVSRENSWRCVGLAPTKTPGGYHLVVDWLPQIGQLLEHTSWGSQPIWTQKAGKSVLLIVVARQYPGVLLSGLK